MSGDAHRWGSLHSLLTCDIGAGIRIAAGFVQSTLLIYFFPRYHIISGTSVRYPCYISQDKTKTKRPTGRAVLFNRQ